MSEESPTSFIERKYPVVKAIIDYIFSLAKKQIAAIVLVVLMGSGVTLHEGKVNHKQIWAETGDHFQDILKSNQLYQLQFIALSNRVAQLETKEKE